MSEITIVGHDLSDINIALGRVTFGLQVRLDQFRDGDVTPNGGGWVHYEGEVRRFNDPETLNAYIADVLKQRKIRYEKTVRADDAVLTPLAPATKDYD